MNQKPNTTNRPNPWDTAKNLEVLRHAPGYPLGDLEPGVKYFVLMLEQLGATTLYSCEGHPREFYVKFSCPYETALRVKACGFFAVEICQADIWIMRISDAQRILSRRKKAQLLRWAAASWERELGALRVL
jgi:hypothetical protein